MTLWPSSVSPSERLPGIWLRQRLKPLFGIGRQAITCASRNRWFMKRQVRVPKLFEPSVRRSRGPPICLQSRRGGPRPQRQRSERGRRWPPQAARIT
jgi:hypothetical protein